MSRRPLTDAEVHARLPAGWQGNSRRISRTLPFETYQAGVEFAVQVAQLAEASDHHPDLCIGYRQVKVTYWTHDVGGVTATDLRAAEAVNAL